MNVAKGRMIQVELKNGETYTGHLDQCDNFMNLTLREIKQTSADGQKFWHLPECYVRGSTIKYVQMPPEILDLVKEDMNQNHQRGPGGRGGRGGGGGRGGRGGRGQHRGGTWAGRGRGGPSFNRGVTHPHGVPS
ncbi:hypothetical protein IWQ60_008835 [Tieghemiomyces parasiticus]|uniref:LSM complex subunit LSM4 n=1 Tax=Tieghemiomyces parasiticus TaxID=78921 RepID=A0A9W7ZW75_9FUNG|nr:hypothetical protein IWQ60_008835 [Tieghemiomyces parasiticus]